MPFLSPRRENPAHSQRETGIPNDSRANSPAIIHSAPGQPAKISSQTEEQLRQLPFHLALLASSRFDANKLLALNRQSQKERGGDLGSCWVLDGLIDEAVYFQLAAKKLGVPFVSRLPDKALAQLPHDWPLADLDRHCWCIAQPMARLGGANVQPHTKLIYAAYGEALDQIAQRVKLDPALRQHLCLTTPTILRAALRQKASKRALAQHVYQLKEKAPHLSAHNHFRWPLVLGAAIGTTAIVVGSLLYPPLAVSINFITIAIFLSIAILRVMACCSLPHLRHLNESKCRHLDQIRPYLADWPSYTVMVPLYHEADIVADLVMALSRIDYPANRLSIQLLVEADDEDTHTALSSMPLAPPFEIISIPVDGPRTKPKALNYALSFINSDLLVIFDAEDRPHPFQLREAALRMKAAGPKLACLQGPLRSTIARRAF